MLQVIPTSLTFNMQFFYYKSWRSSVKHPISALPLWIQMAKCDLGGGNLRREGWNELAREGVSSLTVSILVHEVCPELCSVPRAGCHGKFIYGNEPSQSEHKVEVWNCHLQMNHGGFYIRKDSWSLLGRMLAGPDQNLPRHLSNSLKICTIPVLENIPWKHFNVQVLIQSPCLSGCWQSFVFH